MTVLQGSTVLGLRAEGKEAENGGGCQAEGWFPLGGVSKAPIERQHLKYALKGGGHQGFPNLTWLVPSKELKKKKMWLLEKPPPPTELKSDVHILTLSPSHTQTHTLIRHLLVLLSLS